MSAQIAVVQAPDVDIDACASGVKLLAFDLDNTLARSKMPMTQETTHLFASLTHIMPVAIVTGGRYELIESQVLDTVIGHAYADNLDLLPTTGTSYYSWNGRAFERVYAVELSVQQKTRAFHALESCARALGYWYENTQGPRIEDRGSQVTFSALGSAARLEDKETWDSDGVKRQLMADQVQQLLPDLTVRVAGATSIDISQRGLDKSYAVQQLARLHKIDVQDIVFVGDRMTPGGNDYPAAQAGTRAVSVTGPDQTNIFMKDFMQAFTHGLRIDSIEHQAWLHDEPLSISDAEFSLLLALLHAQGETVSRQQLMKDAWGYDDSGDTRLLSVSIARLRAVLEDNPQMPRRIITVRGGGYRLVFS
ncbi:HAD-IIB family hydrolase [Alloscardovia criceti]|uniref:HAD-IIB family hydrolase n=1 Tax=Alloscardovia criceti TaxID=356828 RepID=UPI00037CA576|nr:HAD-IIB family hydrolase [Alloscardovia criceti]